MLKHYQRYRGSDTSLYRNILVTILTILIIIALSFLVFAEEGKWSGLKIIDYTPMFDMAGNRYARIIITNPSQLDKIVEPRYFIATLTDHEGTKVEGMGSWSAFRIQGGEVREITVYFGRQIWPISSIDTK